MTEIELEPSMREKGQKERLVKNNRSVAHGPRQRAIDKHVGQSLMQTPQKWFSANKTVSSLRQLQNQGKYDLDSYSCKGKESKVPRVFHKRSVKEERAKHPMQCIALKYYVYIHVYT